MPQKFAYKARNQSGKLVTGKVEAENRNKAITLLRERKFFVVEIKETLAGEVSINLNKIFQKKVSTKDLSVMCRQFATMTQAGVPILQSLNILMQQCDHKLLKETMKRVTENIEGGVSLAESFKSFPKVFPPIFISMVEAGEVGGALDQVLERLAANFEKEHELKEKVKSAMTYPAVVVVVAILAIAALLIFVVPQFMTMLSDMDAPIPLTTQMIIMFSDFLKNFWYIVLFLIAGAVFGYKQAVKTEKGREVKDQVVLKLPVFGPMIQKIIVARFCRSLSTLLKSGVPVLQSLEVVKNIAGNYAVIKSIKEAEDSIKEGQSISLPLQKSRVFPPMVTRMMAIGEETGAIDTLLEKIADFYEREVDDLVSRLSSMLEPVLIVGMGGVVGFIILSIMLPMFSVIENVK
ncbi:MAG: type II secretion system F family protein [Desulfotomaculaceae bacterium]|nr:type II secretion system F family protein [Desulfotomaculaceae bacterium]